MCLGMGVIVAVQTGKDEISKLEIPVTAGEVKRDSGLYRSYRNVAEQIKAAFDAMGGVRSHDSWQHTSLIEESVPMAE